MNRAKIELRSPEPLPNFLTIRPIGWSIARPLLHLGVVALEKGAYGSPSKTAANFTYTYIYIYIYIYIEREREREEQRIRKAFA